MGDFSLRVLERTVHRLGALYLKPKPTESDTEGGLHIERGGKEMDLYKIISRDIDKLVEEEMTEILNNIEKQLFEGIFYIQEKSLLTDIHLVRIETHEKAESTESSKQRSCIIDLKELNEEDKTQVPDKICLFLKVNIGKNLRTNTMDLYEIDAEFFYDVAGEQKNAGYSNILRGFDFQRNVMRKIIGSLKNENMRNINGMHISCILNQYTWYNLPKYQNEFSEFKWMISDPRIGPLDQLTRTSFDFLTVDGKEDENVLKKLFIHYWEENMAKESDEEMTNVTDKNTATDSGKTNKQELLEKLNLRETIADICFQKQCIFFLHVSDYGPLIKRFDSALQQLSTMYSPHVVLHTKKLNEFRRNYREKIIASFHQFEMYYIDCDDASESQAKLKHLFSYSNTNDRDKQTAELLLSSIFDCFDKSTSTLQGLKDNFWYRVLYRCNMYAFKKDQIVENDH